ncbi:MAG TPA: hypothetical protein VEZ16_05670 [Microvirga sp.]|nr:hypothetical protein [Microvirga sp.]
MRALVVAAALLSFALPVGADAQSRLPRRSPAERQADQINRSILQEGRQVRRQERIQLDQNQFRLELDRQRNMPIPPRVVGPCLNRAVRC